MSDNFFIISPFDILLSISMDNRSALILKRNIKVIIALLSFRTILWNFKIFK